MITDEVIKEIYRKFSKPHKDVRELRLDYFAELLSKHHSLTITDDEVVINDVEDFSPFKRFLIRSLNAVLEFDKNVAFVFRGHILFLSKESPEMRIHIKPERKRSTRAYCRKIPLLELRLLHPSKNIDMTWYAKFH